MTDVTGYRESLSGFCESRGYEQCFAAMFGLDISEQFGWICYDPVSPGREVLRRKEVRRLLARKRNSPDIQPIVRPGGGTAQYTSDCDIFGKLGKEICETGVALHPRLQDRASFGDYCRGATPG